MDASISVPLGRLQVAGLVLAVVTGALVAGMALERIVSRAFGSEATAIEAPPFALDRQAVQRTRSIDVTSITGWIAALSSPELEGRDTPSPGLARAQRMVARRWLELGLLPAPDADAKWSEWGTSTREPIDDAVRPFLRPFGADLLEFGTRAVEVPDRAACRLVLAGGAPFELGKDFVPLAQSTPEEPVFRGQVSAPVVFAGYGIDSRSEAYDDFESVFVAGTIALILEGEPELGERFGGQDVTAEASIWNKLDALAREGAVGALVVSASPRRDVSASPRLDVSASPRLDGLTFHATTASWSPPTSDRVRRGLPTLRITPEAASRILGLNVHGLRDRIESGAGPLETHSGPLETHSGPLETHSGPLETHAGPLETREGPLARVTLEAGTERVRAELHNVVAWLPGTDPATGDFVIVGAHLDHIGIGPRGRIGRGADDNASGVAALMAIAEALAARPPRSSVLFVAFTGEEDGLLGARALAAALPRPKDRCRGMVNLDMIGKGPSDSVVAFGMDASSVIDRAVRAALATGATGLSHVDAVQNALFFTRSDHHAFHEVGIPALFLFEAWPHRSPDYHTWRDVPETIDAEKVRRVAALATLIVWELAGR